ncbi:MAG: DUF2029 domain-containing protein [Acidobacteria bacterium]|nr:DUF2029 domain-containing protein [Acidobacteriota bacterium]
MTRRSANLLAALALGAAAVRFVFSGVRWAIGPLSGDFAAAWPSGPLAWLRPDFPVTQVIGWESHLWNYGPAMHVVTLPLFLAPRWAMVPPIWAAINLAALAIAFVLCLELSGRRGQLGAAAVMAIAAVWLAFQPLAVCMRQGNIEIVEFLFILIGLRQLVARRDTAAGIAIGWAAMIKFLPVGFVGWLVLRRRWRAAAAAAVVVAAVALGAAFTLDWRRSVALVDVMPRAAESNVYSIHFMSVSSMFLHRSSEIDWTVMNLRWLPEARHAIAARSGLLATVALGVCYALWFFTRRERRLGWEEMGVLFLLMFLLPPWNHEDYFIFALMPLTGLVADAIATRDIPGLAAAAAALTLISPVVPFSVLERTGWFPHSYAYFADVHDLPFWGAVLLLMAVTSRAEAGRDDGMPKQLPPPSATDDHGERESPDGAARAARTVC